MICIIIIMVKMNIKKSSQSSYFTVFTYIHSEQCILSSSKSSKGDRVKKDSTEKIGHQY